MASKPKIIPVGARYHLFRGWWLAPTGEHGTAVMCCGLIRETRVPLQTLRSYSDPDLCQKCLRLRPRERRTLSKAQQERRRKE